MIFYSVIIIFFLFSHQKFEMRCIIEVCYDALQSKTLFLLCIEILYSNSLNDQSKSFNNFFMLKSYKILNFIMKILISHKILA
jgi:hypothetical protein